VDEVVTYAQLIEIFGGHSSGLSELLELRAYRALEI
jgi:hypothetical protein